MSTQHNMDWLAHTADPHNNWEEHPASKADAAAQAERLSKHYGERITARSKKKGYDGESSIRSYTGTAYYDINAQLAHSHIAGIDPDYGIPGAHHREIQGVFKDVAQKAPCPEDVHCYAGMSPTKLMRSPLGGMSFKEGEKVHFPAYTSTSISPDTAVGFANTQGDDGIDRIHHVAHFHVPKGHKGAIYVANFSKHPIEQEMLLNAGTKATYLGRTTHDMRREIDSHNTAHPNFNGVSNGNAEDIHEHHTRIHVYHFRVED